MKDSKYATSNFGVFIVIMFYFGNRNTFILIASAHCPLLTTLAHCYITAFDGAFGKLHCPLPPLLLDVDDFNFLHFVLQFHYVEVGFFSEVIFISGS